MILKQTLVAVVAGAAVAISGTAWGQAAAAREGIRWQDAAADLAKMSQPQAGQPVLEAERAAVVGGAGQGAG